jgi:hypothetical protein
MAFQLSRGLIGQQAGLPAQGQPALGQQGLAQTAYNSQQYNTAYPGGQGAMGAVPGAASATPGSTMSAGVAPYNNLQPQPMQMFGTSYNTALKPEGDGNGFGADSIQGQGPQPIAPKPKSGATASNLSLGGNISKQSSRS